MSTGNDLRIIRVNPARRQFKEGTVPEKFRLLGGRAFTSCSPTSQVDPECDPLHEKNQMVIAPGLLADRRRVTTEEGSGLAIKHLY